MVEENRINKLLLNTSDLETAWEVFLKAFRQLKDDYFVWNVVFYGARSLFFLHDREDHPGFKVEEPHRRFKSTIHPSHAEYTLKLTRVADEEPSDFLERRIRSVVLSYDISKYVGGYSSNPYIQIVGKDKDYYTANVGIESTLSIERRKSLIGRRYLVSIMQFMLLNEKGVGGKERFRTNLEDKLLPIYSAI